MRSDFSCVRIQWLSVWNKKKGTSSWSPRCPQTLPPKRSQPIIIISNSARHKLELPRLLLFVLLRHRSLVSLRYDTEPENEATRVRNIPKKRFDSLGGERGEEDEKVTPRAALRSARAAPNNQIQLERHDNECQVFGSIYHIYLITRNLSICLAPDPG